MPDGDLLVAVAAGIGVLLLLVCIATAAGKLLRGLADERARRAEARVRPELIRLVAGAVDGRPAAVAGRERGADRRAVERVATDLLTKLRGEAHADVVAVLARLGVLDEERRRLGRGGPVRRARAAELLGAARDPRAVPGLLALVRNHRRREVRIVAARALGRIGDPVAVPALFAGLDARVGALPFRTVAQAVLDIGPAAESRLRRELRSGTAGARVLAARVLGVAGAVGAGEVLAAAIAGDPDPAVRIGAAASAGRLGSPCAVGALVDALDAGRGSEERVASAEALGRMSAIASSGALAPLVAEHDVRVAHAAAAALANLGAAGRAYLQTLRDEGGVPGEHAREALRRVA